MKKRGFTLAEVLIAMAMVGVISALTMPTFIANSRNKAHAAKLASTVSAVESAFQSMMASQAEDELANTRFGRNRNAASLGEYLKLNSGDSSLVAIGYSSATPFKNINSNNFTNGIYNRAFVTKNGSVIGIRNDNINRSDAVVRANGGSVTTAIGYMVIDVNGPSMPNRWGRDAFLFIMGNDGMLYPAGSLNYSILTFGNANALHNIAGSFMECTGNTFTAGCTARLIEDNYEINF